MNIDNMTIGEAKAIAALFSNQPQPQPQPQPEGAHPMIGRRCVIRTYSAGVHIGDVMSVTNGMEVLLNNALRLWKWEGGGLSLSAVARNGIKGGRLNRTGEIYLTNVIEFIPITERANKTYEQFIED